MPSSFLDVCRFTPNAGGTADWTFSSAVLGYQSPAAAGIVNAATYSYRAESSDLSQWEIGTGTYNTGTGVLTRTTVLYNSAGTGTSSGQSGSGTRIVFSSAPQVAIVALAEDLISISTALQKVNNLSDVASAATSRTNLGLTATATAAAGQLPATATNDNASAGDVGEFISSTVVQGSAVSLTNNTAANLTSISLTAGDWDVVCQMYFLPAATTTVSGAINSISTTSGTLDLSVGNFNEQAYVAAGTAVGATNIGVITGPRRISLAVTTTVYAVAEAFFGTSTLVVYGILRARRVR